MRCQLPEAVSKDCLAIVKSLERFTGWRKCDAVFSIDMINIEPYLFCVIDELIYFTAFFHTNYIRPLLFILNQEFYRMIYIHYCGGIKHRLFFIQERQPDQVYFYRPHL